jgi:hypothetical protein
LKWKEALLAAGGVSALAVPFLVLKVASRECVMNSVQELWGVIS